MGRQRKRVGIGEPNKKGARKNKEWRGQMLQRSLAEGLGRYLFDDKQYEPARDSLGLAQIQGGSHRDLQLGFLFQRRGLRTQAKKSYERAVLAGEKADALFSNLGVLELNRGEFDKAVQTFKRGLSTNPDSVSLLYNLSTAYWRTKQWDKVIDLLRKVLALNPRHQEAQKLLPKAQSLQRIYERQKIFQEKRHLTEEELEQTSSSPKETVSQ